MNIQIFGTSKCFDTKKAQRYFKERGIKFQMIDLAQKGMSKGELDSVLKAVGGLDNLLDQKSKSYASLAYLAYDEDKKEKLLEDGINAIGLGPQGMGGKYSVMGVHIENTPRHPSTIGVAVNVGCWSHRRGHIIFDKDLNYTIDTHSGVTL